MPRKRYSEETRRQVMQEMEQGKTVEEVIRRHGIAEATYYRWRAQFRPIRPRDDSIYRQLEDENRQLRDICAESALEIRLLKQELVRLRRGSTSD
jgi:putative transposase